MQNALKLLNPAFVVKRTNELGFGRLLTTALGKLGIGLWTSGHLVKALKIITHPFDYIQRRNVSRFVGILPDHLRIPKQDGALLLRPGVLPDCEIVVKKCQSIFESRQKEFSTLGPDTIYVNMFSRNLDDVDTRLFDLTGAPEIVDFAVDGMPGKIAADYLGEVPILGSITLMATKVNKSTMSSQLFHLDCEDYRQVKVFVLASEVDGDAGPLSYIPADASAKVAAATNYQTGRLEDDQVYDHAPRQRLVEFMGSPGSVLFIDNSRCFHFGSRSRGKNRLMLEIQYLSRFNVIEPPMPRSVVLLPESEMLADRRRLRQLIPSLSPNS